MKNYNGYYMSTGDFVLKNNLEKEAENVFGKDWEPNDDVNQIQELVNSVSNEYVVKAIEGITKKDSRIDDYIGVYKIN